MLKVLPGVVQTPNGLSNGPSFNPVTVTAQTSSVGNGLNEAALNIAVHRSCCRTV